MKKQKDDIVLAHDENMEQVYHVPVLLHPTVDGLDIKPDGVYVDVTFGGGGHSREILRRLGPNGRLIAFDQDQEAWENKPDDDRLTLVRHNFRFMEHFLHYLGIEYVDGILADLGVSSHHFDDAERGFSFRFDAPLDMRMSKGMKHTAADIIATYDEAALTNILATYGEVQNPRKMAQALIKARSKGAIKTTGQLRELIEQTTPAKMQSKVLAQLFQALRIEVNQEMRALRQMLLQSVRVLKPGSGRLSVIAYHSLEDRMVKNLIKSGDPLTAQAEQDIYGAVDVPLEAITRKAIVPDNDEITRNPRSRSAKLRVAIRKEEDDE
ncbi:MAG: 16S rRNA (cytosine(1402)-N(4))-methyltransferase RsmH [Bacteroidia bacterium]|nr:16S rRNA (cytosine(1402)-N(4))-methyltransferase RsmH [Bacteroidia bacterium]